MKSVKIIFSFFEAVVLIMYSSAVSANGWNTYVDSVSEGRGSSGMFEGILLMVVLGGIILFAWTAYGKKSIRYVYGPMVLGLVVVLLIVDHPERILSFNGIIFGPVAGLIVGWLIIFGLNLIGVIDYFEYDDEKKSESRKINASESNSLNTLKTNSTEDLINVENIQSKTTHDSLVELANRVGYSYFSPQDAQKFIVSLGGICKVVKSQDLMGSKICYSIKLNGKNSELNYEKFQQFTVSLAKEYLNKLQ